MKVSLHFALATLALIASFSAFAAAPATLDCQLDTDSDVHWYFSNPDETGRYSTVAYENQDDFPRTEGQKLSFLLRDAGGATRYRAERPRAELSISADYKTGTQNDFDGTSQTLPMTCQ